MASSVRPVVVGAGAVLAAVVLGSGVVALAGGLVALAFTAAEFASPDHVVLLSGGQAAASAVLAGAGVPAGIVALALGVNAVRWIRVRGLAGYRTAAAGLVSRAVGLAMYLVALGVNFVGALSYG
ncbi:MAG TPA: hypothetical protein VGF54_04600 [Streptosporangiaceae bacterium]